MTIVDRMRRLPTKKVNENFLMSSTQAIGVSTLSTPTKYGQTGVSIPMCASIVVLRDWIMNEMWLTVKLN